jgi:polyadenylate-binding protein
MMKILMYYASKYSQYEYVLLFSSSQVNGMQIGDKLVYVGEFISRKSRTPTEPKNYTNLYMKNLPIDIEESTLKEKLAPHGAITSIMLQKDKNNR